MTFFFLLQDGGYDFSNQNILSNDDEDELEAYLAEQRGEAPKPKPKPAAQELGAPQSNMGNPLGSQPVSSSSSGFPMNPMNFSNPLAAGFNPLNPLAPAGTGAFSQPKPQTMSSMGTNANEE